MPVSAFGGEADIEFLHRQGLSVDVSSCISGGKTGKIKYGLPILTFNHYGTLFPAGGVKGENR